MNKAYTHSVKAEKDYGYVVEVTVSAETYKEYYDKALDKLAADVKIAGFRPGKAPRNAVEAKVGNEAFSEAIRTLLPSVAVEIIDAEKLNPVTPLDYDVKKASNADGIEFTFTFTNYPTIKLGDFGKIKLSEPETEVTEDDINKVITNLFSKQEAEKGEKAEAKEGEKKKGKKAVASADKTTYTLASITDEMVKGLGFEGVVTVAQLRELIVGRLQEIKSQEQQHQYEDQLLEEAVKLSDIPLPAALVDYQTKGLVDSYLNQIAQLKINLEDFLKAQDLTTEKLAEQKKEQARKQLATEFLLSEIAKEYKVIPVTADIEAQIQSISDPELRGKYDSYEGRRYILSMLLQQRGLQKLKELTGGKKATKSDKK